MGMLFTFSSICMIDPKTWAYTVCMIDPKTWAYTESLITPTKAAENSQTQNQCTLCAEYLPCYMLPQLIQ